MHVPKKRGGLVVMVGLCHLTLQWPCVGYGARLDALCLKHLSWFLWVRAMGSTLLLFRVIVVFE